MATLQKFKLLASQCVAPSPTRSPRTSPVVHFHRRKTTLRMLLTRTPSRRASTPRHMPKPPSIVATLPPEKKIDNKDSNGRKLKDLFVSSPPFEEKDKIKAVNEAIGGKGEVVAAKLNALDAGSGSPRPGWVGFRHRFLLKRAWRPMLVAIPE